MEQRPRHASAQLGIRLHLGLEEGQEQPQSKGRREGQGPPAQVLVMCRRRKQDHPHTQAGHDQESARRARQKG